MHTTFIHSNKNEKRFHQVTEGRFSAAHSIYHRVESCLYRALPFSLQLWRNSKVVYLPLTFGWHPPDVVQHHIAQLCLAFHHPIESHHCTVNAWGKCICSLMCLCVSFCVSVEKLKKTPYILLTGSSHQRCGITCCQLTNNLGSFCYESENLLPIIVNYTKWNFNSCTWRLWYYGYNPFTTECWTTDLSSFTDWDAQPHPTAQCN